MRVVFEFERVVCGWCKEKGSLVSGKVVEWRDGKKMNEWSVCERCRFVLLRGLKDRDESEV